MYLQKEINLAIKTYLQLGSLRGTLRKLGYPSKPTLRKWIAEYKKNGRVVARKSTGRPPAFSKDQELAAVSYYLENGRSIVRTIKALGYPICQRTLRRWLRKHQAYDRMMTVPAAPPTKHTLQTRLEAVAALRRGKRTAISIAREYGISRTTLYNWAKEFPLPACKTNRLKPLPQKTGLNKEISAPSAEVEVKAEAEAEASLSSSVRTAETEVSEAAVKKQLERALAKVARLEKEVGMLQLQAKTLQQDVHHLAMQKDILVKCAELLKKEPGVNPEKLSNRDKALVIDALRPVYRLAQLLKAFQISKSSYCYQANALRRQDKHEEHRRQIKDFFQHNYRCYGYRRIKACLTHIGIVLSEKVVRRLMREEGLQVHCSRRRKYSSYRGEISPEVPNVIARNFHASAPNQKWLTDITEFALPDGKVYLSPIIDCYDGMPVSWSVGTSPSAELVNSMLQKGLATLKPGEAPIIHSDRGCHYRWPEWIQVVEKFGLTRSMSKKGCSPDNAACEGFFGRMKNEMFYGRSWIGTTASEFIRQIEAYMKWYAEERIKVSLGGRSPRAYRQSRHLT